MKSEVLLEAIDVAIREYQKTISDEKKTEIPQADDLDKIMMLPFLISQGIDTDYKVAEHFQFSKRQSSYYRKAAQILGLVSTDRSQYYLTSEGKKYVLLPPQMRRKYFAKLLFEFPVIQNLVYSLRADQNNQVTMNDLIEILKRNSILTGQTLTRRAHTISKWLEWIERNIDLIEI